MIFLLIDGNSLLHRAYHALPPLTDRQGEPANAVFGFSNMLLKAIGELKPTHIACAFDTKAPTFRHVEFAKYKAQRPAPPPDLYVQLPKVKKVLEAFGIPYFEKEGYEADDILATLAKKCQMSNVKCQIVILSGDRDILQLVDGHVKVQMPSFTKVSEGKPGWGVLMGASEVKEKYGVTPAQIVDYKSLIGDASDNVPGVGGIGPKTAAELLQKYGTLENIFKHLNEVPGSVRAKLEVGQDIALAAKRLVELDRGVDLTICLPAGRLTIDNLQFTPDWESVRKEYEKLGFKSIVAKLTGSANTSEVALSGVEGDSSEVGQRSNRKPKTDNSDQLELI